MFRLTIYQLINETMTPVENTKRGFVPYSQLVMMLTELYPHLDAEGKEKATHALGYCPVTKDDLIRGLEKAGYRA